MAIASFSLNDGSVENVYEPISINGTQVLYRNTAGSTLALPMSAEISHQAGSLATPDRHLLKLALTDDSTDGSIIKTGGIHVVWTVPRQVITPTQITKLTTQMADFLVTVAYRDSVLNGSFPA